MSTLFINYINCSGGSNNKMEVFDWEERHHRTPLYAHIIAGMFAGVSQHLSMIPIDNIKTHCQVAKSIPISQIISKIYHSGGLTNFYSGSSIVAVGCAPAHAIYFAMYEKSMEWLNCHPEKDFWKFAFVGAFSAVFHDLIMTPTEALKQRVQLQRSDNARISIREVALTAYKKEGMIAFYRSFPVNYAMNIPFGSLIIAFNQRLKYIFGVKQGDNSLNYYFCGGLAGAIASIPTTPLDVIKTKLNTQHCVTQTCEKRVICNVLSNKIERLTENLEEGQFRSQRGKLWMQNRRKMSTMRDGIVKYRNVWDTIVKISKQEGVRGFFRGLHMRMLIQSISSGVSWGTYQILKDLLAQESKH